MKPDLYQALGVARDAKPGDIRKAYRQAAKRAHPDGGGSVESFALVRTAVEVLSDDERRKQYDETGQFGDKPVDNRESLAMTVAMNAVDAVLGQILKRGGDPAHYDVVADAKKHLDGVLAEIAQKIANTHAEAKAIQRLAKRFKAKKGRPNRIGAMLEARAADTERNAAKGAAEKENVEGALKILDDQTFDYEDQLTGSGRAERAGQLSVAELADGAAREEVAQAARRLCRRLCASSRRRTSSTDERGSQAEHVGEPAPVSSSRSAKVSMTAFIFNCMQEPPAWRHHHQHGAGRCLLAGRSPEYDRLSRHRHREKPRGQPVGSSRPTSLRFLKAISATGSRSFARTGR